MSASQDVDWLQITRRDMPLIVSLPHTGTEIPLPYDKGLTAAWLALKDTDWWIDRLYSFAAGLGATIIRTAVSRTVIDVNRDPSGLSLYRGQATTELCPTTTFDGEPLYEPGCEPTSDQIAERRRLFFDPYHAALAHEIFRLRAKNQSIVIYDCHSIRSIIPRLFQGTLPIFNIGTNDGASCSSALTSRVEMICDSDNSGRVTNGRFKGGYITRTYGRPIEGVHAIQMELACRGYMGEVPGPVGPGVWPAAFDEAYAGPIIKTLKRVLESCLDFAPSE